MHNQTDYESDALADWAELQSPIEDGSQLRWQWAPVLGGLALSVAMGVGVWAVVRVVAWWSR